MSVPFTRRLAEHRRTARDRRALARAIEGAPTDASRRELLALASR